MCVCLCVSLDQTKGHMSAQQMFHHQVISPILPYFFHNDLQHLLFNLLFDINISSGIMLPDIGFSSLCCEYILLLLINKEVAMACGRAEYSETEKSKQK